MSSAFTQFQAAMVDLDGTMIDTLGDFEVSLNRMLADLDLPLLTRALVERTVGKGSEHLIRSVLAHQLALPEVKGLANVCEARSPEHCTRRLGSVTSTTIWPSMANLPRCTTAWSKACNRCVMQVCNWRA